MRRNEHPQLSDRPRNRCGPDRFLVCNPFSGRAPENLQRLLIHVAIVMAAGWMAPSVTGPLIASGFPTAMTALFVVVLPVLIYTFLAGAWVLQMVHETFSRFKK